MTANPSIDPARFLAEHLERASRTSRAAHELTCQTPDHVVTPSHTTSVDST